MNFKPKFQHTAACLLALILLSSSVASCARPSESQSETDSADISLSESAIGDTSETEPVYTSGIQKTDYDCDFNIVFFNNGFEEGTHFPTEEQRDILDGTSYDRLLRIDEHLGVICRTVDAGSWIEYAETVNRGVMSGSDDYQLVMTPAYEGIVSMVTAGSLHDLATLPTIDLDAPWWNHGVMDGLTVQGKYYLGYSDLSLSNAHIMIFNKSLALEYRIDDLYALVRSKTWTVDRLFTLSSRVSKDDGNGKWDANDTYGLTGWGWVNLISFAPASEIKIVDQREDGVFYIAYEDNLEKLQILTDKIKTAYNADYTWFWRSTPEDGTVLDFAAGTSLFRLYSSADLYQLRSSDVSFGILPYPLYDEAQKQYYSMNWNGQMAVPASIKNTVMVGEVLELLNEYSAPVTEAYYERLLGAKLSDAPDDTEMLDIIWDSQVSDIGLVFCNAGPKLSELLYMIPNLCEHDKNLSSYLKANVRPAQRSLDQLFDQHS